MFPSSEDLPPMGKYETLNSLLLLSQLNLCKRCTSLNENTEMTPWTKHEQLLKLDTNILGENYESDNKKGKST